MNLLNLSALCHDEQSSVIFLQNRNILHPQRQCLNGHDMNLSFSDKGIRWRCKQRQCRTDKGIRTNNWLENTRLSFRKVVLFIYCWAHEMSSIEFCRRELELDDNTVVDWANYLREVCASHLLAHPIVIGGPNTVVEIDESLFSRRKNNAGRVFPHQWVFGGICRQTKECFVYAVPDRSAATLLPIIAESVRPGTTIMSDEWRSYRALANDVNFQHLTVNHSHNFVDPNTGAHTQNIEANWSVAKQKNKKRCGTHRSMIDSYLCEFMWRKQLNGADPFERILLHIAQYYPPQ